MNIHVITFICGDTEYGININQIDCVLPGQDKITKLPEMHNYMKGVIQLRDNVIPIVDLRILLEHKIQNTNYKIIVININNNKIGFIIDDICQVLNLNAEIHLPESFKMNKYIKGVLNVENKNIILLDEQYIGYTLSGI